MWGRSDYASAATGAKGVEAICDPTAFSGVVLDPFCGTETTNLVAFQLGRKSIGIDMSSEHIELAQRRCQVLL